MKPLKRKPTILITRPQPAGDHLCEQVNALGLQAIAFPTIAFLPPEDPQAMQQTITDLAEFDWLIFISPQAVYATSAPLRQHWPTWPAHLKIAAVGAGTAAVLQAENFPDVLYPADQWNSEGLLELNEFKQLDNQKIALVCGADGRDLLAKTLTARGANVTSLIAYRRCLPTVSVKNILRMLRKQTIDCIVSTSNDSLQNLTTLLAQAQPQLTAIPLLVISQRMLEKANELGFKQILLAKNASHDAIMAVLNEKFAHQFLQGLPMEQQTEHAIDSETTLTPKRTAWGSIGILFSAFSAIVLIAAFYFSYNALMASDNKLAAATAAITDKVSANEQALTQLRQAVEATQNNSKTLQAALTDQQNTLNQLHSTDQMKDALSVGEAQYLAALAQDNLQIGDNVALVINLLQTADQKVRDLTNPNILPIRKALAADIAALQAVPTVDTTGIYLQLVALNTQADKLPLPTLRPAQETMAMTNEGKRIPWWKRGLQQSWDVIRNMVVIRYNKSGQIPFITPEQQQYLYQNLHAMFEQAMTAVVHKQPEIYQASLEQATRWINQYFIVDAAATQAMLTSLSQLQSKNIKPALPDINATLQALRDFAATTQQADNSSPTTTSQQ
jgi:uncharacterized protein HemX/uroporphyrinogen-III synthase